MDHPATSLTTVTTTTIFFALTLPQRWISTLLSPKRNPKPLKPKDNRRKVPIIVPLSSYFSFVKWDAFSGRTPKETLKTRNRAHRNPKPVKLKTTAKKSLVSGIPFLFPPFVTVTLALVLRPLPFLLLLVLVRHSQKKQKHKQTNYRTKSEKKTSGKHIHPCGTPIFPGFLFLRNLKKPSPKKPETSEAKDNRKEVPSKWNTFSVPSLCHCHAGFGMLWCFVPCPFCCS